MAQMDDPTSMGGAIRSGGRDLSHKDTPKGLSEEPSMHFDKIVSNKISPKEGKYISFGASTGRAMENVKDSLDMDA